MCFPVELLEGRWIVVSSLPTYNINDFVIYKSAILWVGWHLYEYCFFIINNVVYKFNEFLHCVGVFCHLPLKYVYGTDREVYRIVVYVFVPRTPVVVFDSSGDPGFDRITMDVTN